MFTAKKNFAYGGKTYFVGDEVPKEVAEVVNKDLTEAPKLKDYEGEDE